MNKLLIAGCFGIILSMFITPFFIENQKMIPIDSSKVWYTPNKEKNYEQIPIDIKKNKSFYTSDIDIYKCPSVAGLLAIVEIMLLVAFISSVKNSSKHKKIS